MTGGALGLVGLVLVIVLFQVVGLEFRHMAATRLACRSLTRGANGKDAELDR